MDLKLLLLGINISIISALLLIYGVVAGNSGLVGVFASSLLMGFVLVALSFSTQEGILNTYQNYAYLLTVALTSVIEDLDLLDAKMVIARKNGGTYLVLSKIRGTDLLEPGIGVNGNSPYLTIPVDNVLDDVEEIGDLNPVALEASLIEVLVRELSICNRLGIEMLEDRVIRLNLVDLDRRVREYLNYPIDPCTLLTMVAVARLTGRDVFLRERSIDLNRVVYVFEVGFAEGK